LAIVSVQVYVNNKGTQNTWTVFGVGKKLNPRLAVDRKTHVCSNYEAKPQEKQMKI